MSLNQDSPVSPLSSLNEGGSTRESRAEENGEESEWSSAGYECRVCSLDTMRASTLLCSSSGSGGASSSRDGMVAPSGNGEASSSRDGMGGTAEPRGIDGRHRGGGGGGQASKNGNPAEPTPAERAAHAATHLPYRSWCEWCVKCRLDNPSHTRIGAEELSVPEIGLDYAFIRKEEETATLTILLMKDRKTRALRARVMRKKGTCLEEAVEGVIQGVRDFRINGRVMVKTDNEPSLIALRNAAIERLPGGAIPVTTAARESESNGSIENGVKLFKGLLREHLAALEQKLEGQIASSHPVMVWLVGHVSDLITKYLQGKDGKSGYERLFGKPVRDEAFGVRRENLVEAATPHRH